jgi:hypothetical protein
MTLFTLEDKVKEKIALSHFSRPTPERPFTAINA